MQVDIISIFPAYLAPLELSLMGRARNDGLIDIRCHDLRRWTHDRHHTVDDSPYGGGAGMVMKPEPWGEAIDSVLAGAGPASRSISEASSSAKGSVPLATEPPDGAGASTPLLIVPAPSGTPLTQSMAERLSAEPWLVFACGRYEGIDQRVVDHYRERSRLAEISVGDVVLNGGEVAAMVIIEAVARLLPGFLGNAASLTEESHGTGGLLEYPVYTKPVKWRGAAVPQVLLSGDHGKIATWRREQALRRTAERRPDLLHRAEDVGLSEMGSTLTVTPALAGDAPELLILQRCCWVSEAQLNLALDLPPLVESLIDVRESFDLWTTFVVRARGRLVGSVRARHDDGDWRIGRLMVAPDLQGRGLGRWLLGYIESKAPPEARAFELCTGARSAANLRRYRNAGYRPTAAQPEPGVVVLRKGRSR